MLQKIEALEKRFEMLQTSVSAQHIDIGGINERLSSQQGLLATQEKLIVSIASEQQGAAGAEAAAAGVASAGIATAKTRTVLPESDLSLSEHNTSSSSSDYSDNSGDECDDESSGADVKLHRMISARRRKVGRQRPPAAQAKKSKSTQPKTSPPTTEKKTDVKFSDVVKQGAGPKSGSFSSKASSSTSRPDAGFSTPRDQRKKEHRKRSSVRKLFVYNALAEDSVEDVRAYLDKWSLPCVDVHQTSHKDARKKSFAISVKNVHVDTFLECKWPDHVKIREFIDNKRH